jgi:hypothetical protein
MNTKIVIFMITIIPFFAFKLIASLLANPYPMMLGLGGTLKAGEATNSIQKEDIMKTSLNIHFKT